MLASNRLAGYCNTLSVRMPSHAVNSVITRGRYRHGMFRALTRYRLKAIVVGVPALLSAASCVPQPVSDVAVRRLAPAADHLLRRLALDVPVDLARLPVGAVTRALSPAVAASVAQPFLAATRSPADANRAVDCLTAAVYYEARSQSLDGQRAVAQVVLNRVRDRAFPGSVCGVVYQGSTRRTGCQFSFTCDGSMNARREDAAWATARTIATAALGGAVYAPVGSATYYHADRMLPWWAPSLARVGAVGSHIFYRWRGAMERALAYSQSYSGIEPGAPAAAPIAASIASTIAGVTIHRGDAAAAGVTIHRGVAPSAVVASAGGSSFGIRVHRGGAPAGTPIVGGVIVSDEM